MRNSLSIAALILVGLLAATGQSQVVSDEELKQGFTPLFNGKDMSGWLPSPAKTWEVQGGVLVCTGEKGGPWIRTEKEYENFILRLEYNISKGGNSGIFIRCAPKGRASRTGFEIQILDDHGKPAARHSAGAIYDVEPAWRNMSKPAGQWNEVEITCDKRRISVAMNGEQIHDMNLDDEELNAKLKDELKVNKRRQKGHIGLQNHGAHVEFRNIRIKILD